MPIIKTKREEYIIYAPEWKQTLQDAEKEASWLAAWLAFDCIFGKRRNEICRLKRRDVWTQEGYLYVRFFIGKKRNKTATIDKMPYTKKKVLTHYAIKYILSYLEEYDKLALEGYLFPSNRANSEEGYLFPSNRANSEITVKTKFLNRKGEKEFKEYSYHVEGGYRSPQDVYYWIKKVNPNIWAHLGRHTVATIAAEEGATEYDICNILDVSPRTASRYVHHGTKLNERWSEQNE
jgi:integrase